MGVQHIAIVALTASAMPQAGDNCAAAHRMGSRVFQQLDGDGVIDHVVLGDEDAPEKS